MRRCDDREKAAVPRENAPCSCGPSWSECRLADSTSGRTIGREKDRPREAVYVILAASVAVLPEVWTSAAVVWARRQTFRSSGHAPGRAASGSLRGSAWLCIRTRFSRRKLARGTTPPLPAEIPNSAAIAQSAPTDLPDE